MDITQHFTTNTVNELVLAEALRDLLPGGFLLIVDNTPELHVEVTGPDGSEFEPQEIAAIQQLAGQHDPAALTAEEQAAEEAQQAHEAQMDVIRQRAAEDPAFEALAGVLGLTLD